MSLTPIRIWYGHEMASRDFAKDVESSEQLTKAVAPMFFGKHPGVQMLTLTDLIGMWVTGHNKEHRDDALDMLVSGVKLIVTQMEKEEGK